MLQAATPVLLLVTMIPHCHGFGIEPTPRSNQRNATDCISACECDWVDDVTRLNMTCTRVPDRRTFDDFFQRHPLEKQLRITRSKLPSVPAGLHWLVHLTALDLSYNHIATLELGVLDNLTELVSLDLSHNMISHIEPLVFTRDLQPKLLELNLQHNDLKSVDTSFMLLRIKNDVSRVNLTYNKINRITNILNISIDIFDQNDVFFADLRGNNITHVRDVNILKVWHIKNPLSLLRLWSMGFDIRDNPYDCDCDMYAILVQLKPVVKLFENFHDLSLLQLYCAAPAAAKDRRIISLSPELYECSVPSHEGCPSGCRCIRHPGNATLVVYCRERHSVLSPCVLPREANVKLYLQGTGMTQFTACDSYRNVTELDLSHNRITTLPSGFWLKMPNVVYLNLRGNSLSSLPAYIREWNVSRQVVLLLSDNPYTCDCDHAWLATWLRTNQHVIGDVEDVLCGDGHLNRRAIYLLQYEDYNCSATANIITIAAVSIATMCLFVMVLIMIMYRSRIKVWMYLHWNINLTVGNASYTALPKRYDAFICYNNDDHHWVLHKLLPMLENNKPPYKACLHQRDFPVGKSLTAVIENKIRESATVILVLSASSLTSDWCKYELRKSVEMALKDTKLRIVPVLIGDALEEDASSEAKAMLKRFQYVKANDPFFTQKFWYLMPRYTVAIAATFATNVDVDENSPLLRQLPMEHSTTEPSYTHHVVN